jgi:hypothetical protein
MVKRTSIFQYTGGGALYPELQNFPISSICWVDCDHVVNSSRMERWVKTSRQTSRILSRVLWVHKFSQQQHRSRNTVACSSWASGFVEQNLSNVFMQIVCCVCFHENQFLSCYRFEQQLNKVAGNLARFYLLPKTSSNLINLAANRPRNNLEATHLTNCVVCLFPNHNVLKVGRRLIVYFSVTRHTLERSRF